LNLVGDFIHPDIEVSFAFLKHLLCYKFFHSSDFLYLLEVDEISQNILISDALKRRNLSLGTHGHWWHFVDIFLHVSHDVLDHLLHENTVVSLGSHT